MVCRGVDGVGKQPKGGETPGGHCYHSGPGGASRGSVCSNPRRTVALGEGLLDRNCEHRERYTAPGKTAGRAGGVSFWPLWRDGGPEFDSMNSF